MKISIAAPTENELQLYRESKKYAAPAYSEIGASLGQFPPAYDHDYNRVKLGAGKADFLRAVKGINAWRMFPASWVKIYPERPLIAEGEVVLVIFRLFGLWWFNACRIVYTLNTNSQFGFAYGTLKGHVEKGEECFQVYMDEREQVWYEVSAFSRPNHLLTRLAYPLARSFQRRFVRDSFASMKSAMKDEY